MVMFGNNYGYYNPSRIGVPTQPMNNQFIQPQSIQPTQVPINNISQGTLQGKMVDSVDVAKNSDIPLDGTITYFPLLNGTAIVTRQLQNDGTSRVTIYKPVVEEEKSTLASNEEYITREELEKKLKSINNIENLDELVDLPDKLEQIKKDIKELKSKLKVKED